MTQNPESPSSSTAAEGAFVEYLEQREEGGASFDAFCAARPELEPALRRIHGAWQWADGMLGDGVPPDSRPGEPESRELPADLAGPRYEVRREIARGGIGIVFEAYDRTLRRSVALKVLRPEAGTRHRSAARFLEEAQVTGQLEHPAIVPIYDAGETPDGQFYYTMPHIHGRELGQLFRLARENREGWNTTRALSVLLRVCEAVGAAHARGVIHRDLKPSNVMVGFHGEVRVMDWGLARIVDAGTVDAARGIDAESGAARAWDTSESESSGDTGVRSARQDRIRWDEDSSLVTLDGQVIGTPSYMSPEQARGKAAVERTADVYSAGAMLRLLLVGERPYAEDRSHPSSETVLDRLVAGPPPPLAKVAPDAAPELVAICERAMARDPGERYADMAELADDLRAFLERRVVSAYRTGAGVELVQWFRRNPALSLSMAAGVAVLLVGLLASWTLKRQADAQAARAERNFESALSAVDSMLDEVGARDLASVPGLQPVRVRLLDEARRFYETFLLERGDDSRVRGRLARAHARLASVLVLLGDHDAALRTQTAGIALLANDATTLTRRTQLTDMHLGHAKILLQTTDLDAARDALDAGLEIAGELRVEHASDPMLRALEAKLLATVGEIYIMQRNTAGDAPLSESVALGNALSEDPRVQSDAELRTRVLADLSHALNLQGTLYLRTGRLPEAREALERSVELREMRYAETGQRREASNLIASWGSLSQVLTVEAPGSPEALDLGERMIELSRRLNADYPSVPHYVYSLIQSLLGQGVAHAASADFELAHPLVDEAVALWEQAPEHVRSDQRAQMVEGLYYVYSWCMSALGRFEELLARVGERPPVTDTGSALALRIRGQALGLSLEALLAGNPSVTGSPSELTERYLAELSELTPRLVELDAAANLLPDDEAARLSKRPEFAPLFESDDWRGPR